MLAWCDSLWCFACCDFAELPTRKYVAGVPQIFMEKDDLDPTYVGLRKLDTIRLRFCNKQA
eukprot:2963701-Ditylum_brightwellii.AAC.1